MATPTTTPIRYTDEVGLEYVIEKLKLALDYGYLQKDPVNSVPFTKQEKDFLKTVADDWLNVAKLDGATFTDVIHAVTPATGSKDTSVATTAFVDDAVTSALGSVTGLSFDGVYTSYEDLTTQHPTGTSGIIYLVQNSGSVPNSNDEYFWNTKTNSYELFGTTAISLINYVQFSDLNYIETSEIDKMFTDAGFVFPSTS